MRTHVERHEIARRVRAARAYADLSREELGEAAGLAPTTIKRIELAQREITSNEELFAIATACGVPDKFMADGFQDVGRASLVDALMLIETLIYMNADEVSEWRRRRLAERQSA